MGIGYGVNPKSFWANFTETGRNHMAKNTPVANGLVFSADAGAIDSYSGSGSSITDLSGNGVTATLFGDYSFNSSDNSIRLNNDKGSQLSNQSYIQLSSITDITTVSLWFYQHTTQNYPSRYLLDMRTGGSSGWIYSGGLGTNWSSGTIYVNGENLGTTTWAKVETNSLENWVNIVVTANTPATDDMNLFSRFSDNEGLNVSFGAVQIYNRLLSDKEVKLNFNSLRHRYGI